MGVNYGIRGGDILDLNQINSYIFNLEQSANVNIFLNTHHFNQDATDDDFIFTCFYSKDFLCVASVYVMLQSDADPTVYPELPVITDITNNAAVTLTKQEDNKQIFNFKKFTIDYKIIVMRTRYSLSVSNVYLKVKFNAINSIKDLTINNKKINQFLCWQESTSKIDYARLSENATGVYTDFSFTNQTKSAFAMCLMDKNNKAMVLNSGETSEALPISEFFGLGNFTYEYVKSLRFIFRKTTSGSTFILRPKDYRSYIVISLQVENTFNDFIEYSISNVNGFIEAVNFLYAKAQNKYKFKGIIQRNNIVDGVANTYDYSLSARCENVFWSFPPIASTDSLNAATLYCTRQNANSTHNAGNFHGEIGLDLPQNNQDTTENNNNFSLTYSFFIVFKNGFFQTDKEFLFDYEFANGYIMKMGFTENLTT